MDITVQKGTQVKTMTQEAWDLLKNKNGWEKVVYSSEPVINSVVVPETGDKKVDNNAVVNEANQEVTNQPVINEVETAKEKLDNGAENNEEVSTFNEVAKANLNKEKIKNYLDGKEVSYHPNTGLDKLIEKLSEVLEGNIETLKAEFKL